MLIVNIVNQLVNKGVQLVAVNFLDLLLVSTLIGSRKVTDGIEFKG